MTYDNSKTLNKRINSKKYSKIDKEYFQYLQEVEKNKIPSTEIIFQFPIYIGTKSLGRYLQFYELYKKTNSLSGHIADVGSWKGSSLIYLSKLVKIFENNSSTKLFGFDWFKGQITGNNDLKQNKGKYNSNYKDIKTNIKKQNLDEKTKIIKIDLSKNLDNFFKKNPWLRFKYVLIDCGIESVLEKTVPLFWNRLLKGGVMILDHYNNPISPTESNIVDQVVGNNTINNFYFSSHPSAYVFKN